MKKILLATFLLVGITRAAFSANGTVTVIDKIAPQNGAFVGVVDSSQTLNNVTNFNNNLSAADDTVQKALDTLDNMSISGGSGSGYALEPATVTPRFDRGAQFSRITVSTSNINVGFGPYIFASSVTAGQSFGIFASTKIITDSGRTAGITLTPGTTPLIHMYAGDGTSVIVISSEAATVQSLRHLRLGDSDDSNYVGFVAPSVVPTNVIWKLPSGDSVGCLQSDGSGNLTISSCGGGGGGGSSTLAVGTGTASNFTTNITSPTAVISFLGTQFGSIANGTTNFISLKNSGVTAGTYGSATQVSSVTVGADGRVTGAANVTISLTNSNLQAGTYSNVTVPAANVATGNLGPAVVTSSAAVNSIQDASIVGVSGSKITGTGTIPNAAINGSSITKAGVLVAGTNITLTPGSGNTTISAASAVPVGPNNSVQFSSFGALSGSSNLTFSPTDYSFTVGWSSSTRVTKKQTYTKFTDGFYDEKYIYDQFYTPTDDGGSYIVAGYYLFGSTTGAFPGDPNNSAASGLSLFADDGCPSFNIYSKGGISSTGGAIAGNCFGVTIQNGSSEQFNASNGSGMNFLLHEPLSIYGYTGEAARLLFRDDDGYSPSDGVILKAPATVDQISGLDNLVLILPSTGGAIGDSLRVSAVSNNEFTLAFSPVSGGGGGGTTIWSKLNGSALDNAVSTINVTAPLTATSSPSGQINIGVLSSSATLQGVITAGNGISVTNGSGIVTIANTQTSVTGSTTTISLTIDGQGSAIVAGSTRSITVPFQCVISSWSVTADASGSLAVHVSSSTFGNYPTITNMTGAGNGPSLSSQSKRGAAVSGWTQTTIDAGSVISFVVDSASTIKWATIVLWVIR